MTLYYLFLLLSPFQNNPRLGMHLFTLGFIPITPIKVVGIFLVAAALVAPRPRDAAKPIRSAIPILFVALVAYPLLWTVVIHQYVPTPQLSAFVSYLGLLIATRFLITTRTRLRNTVRVAVLAEVIGALWLFKQFFYQHWGRPLGPSSDPNYEALILVMAIPLSAWLAFYDDAPRWRTFGKGALAMLVFSVIITQSRGGTLALMVIAVLGWLRSRHKLRAIVGLALAAMLLIAIAPGRALDRITDYGLSPGNNSSAYASTRIRIDLLYAGLGMLRAHPIVGVGLGRFKPLSVKYNPDLPQNQAGIACNTYLETAAEGGIPSLLIFLALLWLSFRNFRRTEAMGRSADPALAGVAVAMRISMLGYMVAACFLTAEFIRLLWLWVFLSQSLCEVMTAKLAQSEASGQQAPDQPSGREGTQNPSYAVA